MPTYTENFALLRFGGSAWGGMEEWSCGLKLKHLGGSDLAPMQQECKDTIEECVNAISSFTQGAGSPFTSAAKFEWCKLNVIDATTGRYAYPNDPVELPGNMGGGSGGVGIPQVALCVSFIGEYARGPAARGRMFIPCTLVALEVDGQISTAAAESAANKTGAFLTELQTIDSGLGPDAWAPWLYGDGIDGPRDSSIWTVSVGRIYDTQRRRRRSLIEDHQPATNWPPS